MSSSRVLEIKLCIAFWIFGMINNYSYVVMLSAANDILKNLEKNLTISKPLLSNNNRIDLECTKTGSGTILVADIVPTFIFKLVAPFFIQSIKIPHKIVFVTLAAMISFIIVGLSNSIGLTLFGVVLASLSSGVGEVTFLSLTAFYDKNSLLFWSSGTGGAGIFGSLSYAAIVSIISPQKTLFLVSVFPILILLSYLFLLQKPVNSSFKWDFLKYFSRSLTDNDKLSESELSLLSIQKKPSNQEKLLQIKGFLYMTLPLAVVYLFEYVINQALFELLYFPNSSLSHAEQYRWYQVTYQIGVFISRSSIKFIKISKTWIFSLLQGFNVILFILQISYRYIPNIWIVFILILFEGLLGGGAYVNTFYFILMKSPFEYKEFNMGAASFWDSLGISIAGGVSIPIHKLLCDYFSN